jgi:hypothetical protein|tara:strand:+ start:2269 stop:2589 length:321 start_codon:yes stop_codon:yes gene_type:complete
MSTSTRISELKNKLISVHEKALNDTQHLLDQTLAFNVWAMDTQKKCMNLQQDKWHLEWQVRWLEKSLKKIKPNIKLYEDTKNTRDETYAEEQSQKRKKMNGVSNEK